MYRGMMGAAFFPHHATIHMIVDAPWNVLSHKFHFEGVMPRYGFLTFQHLQKLRGESRHAVSLIRPVCPS